MLRSSRTTACGFCVRAASASLPLLACVIATSQSRGSDLITMLRETAESSTTRTDVVMPEFLAAPCLSLRISAGGRRSCSSAPDPIIRRTVAADQLERIVEVHRGLGGPEHQETTGPQQLADLGEHGALDLDVEVDEHVAQHDEVGGRHAVPHAGEVVLAKLDHAPQIAADLPLVLVPLEVLHEERARQAAADLELA